jgi:hypothetical protein
VEQKVALQPYFIGYIFPADKAQIYADQDSSVAIVTQISVFKLRSKCPDFLISVFGVKNDAVTLLP